MSIVYAELERILFNIGKDVMHETFFKVRSKDINEKCQKKKYQKMQEEGNFSELSKRLDELADGLIAKKTFTNEWSNGGRQYFEAWGNYIKAQYQVDQMVDFQQMEACWIYRVLILEKFIDWKEIDKHSKISRGVTSAYLGYQFRLLNRIDAIDKKINEHRSNLESNFVKDHRTWSESWRVNSEKHLHPIVLTGILLTMVGRHEFLIDMKLENLLSEANQAAKDLKMAAEAVLRVSKHSGRTRIVSAVNSGVVVASVGLAGPTAGASLVVGAAAGVVAGGTGLAANIIKREGIEKALKEANERTGKVIYRVQMLNILMTDTQEYLAKTREIYTDFSVESGNLSDRKAIDEFMKEHRGYVIGTTYKAGMLANKIYGAGGTIAGGANLLDTSTGTVSPFLDITVSSLQPFKITFGLYNLFSKTVEGVRDVQGSDLADELIQLANALPSETETLVASVKKVLSI